MANADAEYLGTEGRAPHLFFCNSINDLGRDNLHAFLQESEAWKNV